MSKFIESQVARIDNEVLKLAVKKEDLTKKLSEANAIKEEERASYIIKLEEKFYKKNKKIIDKIKEYDQYASQLLLSKKAILGESYETAETEIKQEPVVFCDSFIEADSEAFSEEESIIPELPVVGTLESLGEMDSNLDTSENEETQSPAEDNIMGKEYDYTWDTNY